MSKLRKYTILILCLICSLGAFAQRRFLVTERWEYYLEKVSGFSYKEMDHHTDAFWGLHASQYSGAHYLFGFSVDGAWNAYINNMPAASNLPGGRAYGFNFLFEYQYSGLLFQFGLGVKYQQVYNNIRDTSIYHYHMHDKWEGIDQGEFTLCHQFNNRKDMARNLSGQIIPIYFGNYIIGPAGVGYFLVGPHISYAFWGNTEQQLEGTTLAKYEPFLGIWHEMDNHGYRKDVPIERKGKQLQLKVDAVAHAEMGYEYTTYRGPHNYRRVPGDRIDCRIRFAGFADFSIFNICPQTNNVFYDTPMESIYDFPTYRMEHVFSTKDAKKYWVRNLCVGVRITVLIGIPRKEWCILCDPWKH